MPSVSRSHAAFDASDTDTEASDQDTVRTRNSSRSFSRTPTTDRGQAAIRGTPRATGRGRGRGKARGQSQRAQANTTRTSNLSRSDHSRLERMSSSDEESAVSQAATPPARPATAKRGRPTNSSRNSRGAQSPVAGPSSRPDPVAGAQRRKQRRPVLRKVDREVWLLQKSTNLLLPKLSFARVVKEILMSTRPNITWRMQSEALEGLQEAAEMYIVQFMEDAYKCTLHGNRVTLKASDMLLVRSLRGTTL